MIICLSNLLPSQKTKTANKIHIQNIMLGMQKRECNLLNGKLIFREFLKVQEIRLWT
jgi:hypothetical protein